MVQQNIRTDKWQIVATSQQKELLRNTVCEFRCLVRCLIGVIYTHWTKIGQLDGAAQIPAVEKLIHQTAKNPNPKYQYFRQRFPKFPSYYRRGAIQFAVGQVSSFITRYSSWQSGIRSRQDASPPRLNGNCGTYPPLYKGQCIKFSEDLNTGEIKVFTGSDWIWIRVRLIGHRQRHLKLDYQRKSPYLIVKEKKCHLSVPFKFKQPKGRRALGRETRPSSDPKIAENHSVLSVDLGINTTATVSVINLDGTVSHREFIHPGRDIDRRDKRLKRISKKAVRTCGGFLRKGTRTKKASLTGKLDKGFGRSWYRKARNINREIAQKLSNRLVKIAKKQGIKYIVFEYLKGWRPKGGSRKSTLKQRFHGWLHRRIADLTEMKWSELGGKVIYVNPRGTSSYAFDGSGKLKRDHNNYQLARFANGKQYNCDLSAAYNIGARGLIKLCGGNSPEDEHGKNSCLSPRSRGTLSMLWSDRSVL